MQVAMRRSRVGARSARSRASPTETGKAVLLPQGSQRSGRARLRRWVLAVLMTASCCGTGAALADEDPEQGLTQREFAKLVEMTSEDPEGPAAANPVPVHNLTETERAALREMHAVRIYKGKEWKDLSPQERFDRVRALRERMPRASLILTVPGGELWAVPPGEDDINFKDIVDRRAVRIWQEEEKSALPVSVAREKSVSQSDKRGSTVERVVVREKRP
jgi:hypothetical protein